MSKAVSTRRADDHWRARRTSTRRVESWGWCLPIPSHCGTKPE